MGNLLGSWRFKEPSTVEECDSTWGSDSESDEPAAEDDSGISDSIGPAESDRTAGDTSPQVSWGFYSIIVKPQWGRGPGHGAVTCAAGSARHWQGQDTERATEQPRIHAALLRRPYSWCQTAFKNTSIYVIFLMCKSMHSNCVNFTRS